MKCTFKYILCNRLDKKEVNRAFIENIIEKKTKETIT